MRRSFWPLLLVLLFASALRLHALSAVALRGDEAFSVVFSALPLREMFARMAISEPNPPLHWLILHYWEIAAGTSEFVVRFPSALAGVVTVALTYRLTHELLPPLLRGKFRAREGGRGWGMGGEALLVAFLAAINPFLTWHAQDARQYSLLAALTTGAIWLTLRAIRRGGRHYLIAAALWWLALFLHYFAAFALVTTIIAVTLSTEGRRQWRPALLSLFFLGLTYLPWAIYVAPLMLSHRKGWIASTSLGDVFLRTLIAFVGGTTLTDPQRILVAVVGIGLALVGTIFALRSQFAIRNSQLLNLQLRRGALHSPISDLQPLTSILLFAWLPPLLLGLLSLWRPAFDERFLTGTIPPVLILIALPIVHWWPDRRWLSAIGVVALILVAGLSLTNYFFNPAFGKSPNWRGIAAYLSTHTSAAELVLQDFQDPAFGYYYQGPAQPVDAPVAPGAATEEQLAAWLDTHPRLWLFVADSTASDGDWLNDHAERLMDEWIFGFRLQAFDSPAGSLAAMIPFERNFSDGIRLIGYRLLLSPIGRGIRGEGLHLTLYWQSIAAASKDYTVFTHVLTTDGVQVAGQDNPPARGRRPTSRWQTGETIVDPYDLTLSADLAPGAYSIQVGLYDPATGARLSVVDSQTDSVTLPEPIELKDAIRDSQFSIRQLE